MSNPVFQLPINLYFEDTDAMGIVYHANYIKYFERARTEWFRSAGLQHMELAALGVGFVTRKADIEWLTPLTMDDKIIATAQVSKLGNASAELEQTILRDGVIVCRAAVLMVCVDFVTKRPIAVPDAVRVMFTKGNV
jgi:acyl-CoA thioester hydrolase